MIGGSFTIAAPAHASSKSFNCTSEGYVSTVTIDYVANSSNHTVRLDKVLVMSVRKIGSTSEAQLEAILVNVYVGDRFVDFQGSHYNYFTAQKHYVFGQTYRATSGAPLRISWEIDPRNNATMNSCPKPLFWA
jgi:hypothetical protein